MVKRFIIFAAVALFGSVCIAGAQSNPQVGNGVLEGIQISTDKGATPDEVVVSCYFIFRDKFSAFYHDIKRKPNRIIFEFYDAEPGTSPIPTSSQAPIIGFDIEKKKVDMNKDMRGLNPDWHDMVQVIFNLTEVPQIAVTEEYSVVSFTYKWTTDPDKLKNYIAKEKNNRVLLWSLTGVGALAGGAVAYFLLQPPDPPPPESSLIITDLPGHTKDPLQFR